MAGWPLSASGKVMAVDCDQVPDLLSCRLTTSLVASKIRCK